LQALESLKGYCVPQQSQQIEEALPGIREKDIKLKKKGSWEFVERLSGW
jgi:hypothetical protein